MAYGGFKDASTISFGSNMNINEQIKKMIADIDLLVDENANGVAEALRTAGEVIASGQRQLISGKSAKLASLIRCTRVMANTGRYRSGFTDQEMNGKFFSPGNPQPVLNVYVGYNREAIEQAPECVIMEFGKPSQNKNRGVRVFSGEKISITVTRKDGLQYRRKVKESSILQKNGMKVDSKGRIIGYVPSINHIRKGFDNKKDEAYEILANKLDEVLKKW